jgi:AFG3 family protein
MSSIHIQQFEKAVERVLAGLEKRNMFSDEEKQLLAYYESGKAVVGWFT